MKWCQPRNPRQYKVKEKVVEYFLSKWASAGIMPKYTAWDKSNPMRDPRICMQRHRPDFMYDLGDRIVIVECDEHQHKFSSSPERCEQMRLVNIAEGYRTVPGGFIPVHVLRYNPDAFKVAGTSVNLSQDQRMKLLQRRLLGALNNQQKEFRLTIEKLFYDEDGSGASTDDNYVQIEHYKTLADFEVHVDHLFPLEGMKELYFL
jgi:hypothetical protein